VIVPVPESEPVGETYRIVLKTELAESKMRKIGECILKVGNRMEEDGGEELSSSYGQWETFCMKIYLPNLWLQNEVPLNFPFLIVLNGFLQNYSRSKQGEVLV
jgi:hypothetical protein